MTGGQHHQLSLSKTECAPTVAEKAAARQSRVLVVPAGHCDELSREEVVGELRTVLGSHGYQTEVFSFAGATGSGWGFTGKALARNGVLRYVRYLKALARRLVKCDVLHLVYYPRVSFMFRVLPLVLLAKFFGRKVVLDHRTPIIFTPGGGERFFVERVWRLCDRVLVLSAYQRQIVNSFGGTAEFIRAGVDLDRIKPRVIKSVQPHIAVAADLEIEHNIASAIRAFKLVKQKYPRTEMTIIGTGSEEASLRAMVERETIHGITFAGPASGQKRTELLSNCDLYLNCSSVDYISAATAEAFACGLPVLTTLLTGGGEVLRSREDIILLPYGDHVGAAERVIELVENPELVEKLSLSSRKTGESYGSVQRRDAWGSLYRCLLRDGC